MAEFDRVSPLGCTGLCAVCLGGGVHGGLGSWGGCGDGTGLTGSAGWLAWSLASGDIKDHVNYSSQQQDRKGRARERERGRAWKKTSQPARTCHLQHPIFPYRHPSRGPRAPPLRACMICTSEHTDLLEHMPLAVGFSLGSTCADPEGFVWSPAALNCESLAAIVDDGETGSASCCRNSCSRVLYPNLHLESIV